MSDLVLRPRSVTELIDAAFQVYRRMPVPFMVASAFVYLPWLAIRLVFHLDFDGNPNASQVPALLVGQLAVYVLAGGVTTLLARGVYLDEPIDVGTAFRQLFGRLVPLVVATLAVFALSVAAISVIAVVAVVNRVLLGPVMTLFLAIAIALPFGVFVAVTFFAIRQAILLERCGVGASLSRSIKLSKGLKWHILGVIFLMAVLTSVPNFGVAVLAQILPSHVVAVVLQTATLILVYPIFGITETVLYFDTRIRNEGFDVEYLASAVPDAATTGPVA